MNSPQSPTKIINVGLGGIAVSPERLRALRPERVTELSASMKDSGLLQPIVLRTGEGSGYWLVAGRHRFEAAKALKWKSIRACIFEDMEIDKAELAEIDENLIRAELSPAERAMHIHARKSLYEKLHPQTKHGSAPGKAGGGKKAKDANFASFAEDTAKKTGRAKRSVELDGTRGKSVVVLSDIIGTSLDKGEELDALGNLDESEQQKLADRAKAGEQVSAKATLKHINRAKREQQLGVKQHTMPTKAYGVIYADPPWHFQPYSDVTGMDRAADNHYPTMDLDAIKALEVPTADDAILLLWATVPMLPEAIEVMKAWGFAYKSNFVWVKDRVGTGYWARNQHELLLVGTRGVIPAPAPGNQYSSVIQQPVGAHSAKPFAVREMIEEMFPTLPRIELFAREQFEGWDTWGNEVEQPPQLELLEKESAV